MSNIVKFPQPGSQEPNPEIDPTDDFNWLFNDVGGGDPHDEASPDFPKTIRVRIEQPEKSGAEKAAGALWSMIIGAATVLFIFTMIKGLM